MSYVSYTWNFEDAARSQEIPNIQFKKINTALPLTTSDFDSGKYKITTYDDLIYMDVSDVHGCDSSFTLEFTVTETFTDTLKEVNYITYGQNIRGKSGTCLTVGRDKNSNRVVIGTIAGDTTIKCNPIYFGINPTVSGVEYTYTLAYNNKGIGNQRVRLYRKRTDNVLDENGYLIVLISESSIDVKFPFISIVDRKICYGSSMWNNGKGWESRFDIADLTVSGSFIFIPNKSIDVSFITSSQEYPIVKSITNLTSEIRSNTFLVLEGDEIEISFHSTRRVNSANVRVFIEGNEISQSKPVDNSYIHLGLTTTNYSYSFFATNILPSSYLLSFKVDFNGTVTDEIQIDHLFFQKSKPILTFDIKEVTETNVTLQITNIEYPYIYSGYSDHLSVEDPMRVEFYASNDTHGVRTISSFDISTTSSYIIDNLGPLESIWEISCKITDMIHDISTQDIAPTSNSSTFGGGVKYIKMVERKIPNVSNRTTSIKHNAGDSFVSISGINTSDKHSSFMTYAALFDSKHTVPEELMYSLHTMSSGSIISFTDHHPPTESLISLDGVFTHANKWNEESQEWNEIDGESGRDLNFNVDKVYYVYVLSVDNSLYENANTFFLEHPFTYVKMNGYMAPYELGIIPIESLHTKLFFTTSDTTDIVSGDFVGYDKSGNNHHGILKLIDQSKSPIVNDSSTTNLTSLDLNNIEMLLIHHERELYNPFTFSMFFKNNDPSFLPVILLEYGVDSPLITVSETNVVITTKEEVLPLVEIPLLVSNFELSSVDRMTFNTDTITGDIVVETTSGSKMLSNKRYNLPLYYECEIRSVVGDSTIYIGQDISGFVKGNPSAIIWGTGAYEMLGTSKYSWCVGNQASGAGEMDDVTANTWAKMSIYVDDEKVIMYQHEGIEYKRILRDITTESFWENVENNQNTVRVGVWDYSIGEYRNPKVGHANIWEETDFTTTFENPGSFITDKWYNIIVQYIGNNGGFVLYINGYRMNVVSTSGIYSPPFGDLYMKQKNLFIDDVRLYTKSSYEIVDDIRLTANKLVELCFEDEVYVMDYDIVTTTSHIYFNTKTEPEKLYPGGTYTFWQTNQNNKYPLIITGKDLLQESPDIEYYIDDSVVTLDMYISVFDNTISRKVVVKPRYFIDNLNPLLYSSTVLEAREFETVSTEAIVFNRGNGGEPIYTSINYTNDAAVNKTALVIKSRESALTIENQPALYDMTVSTWLKIESYPLADSPILYQDGVFEIGIDSSGHIFIQNI